MNGPFTIGGKPWPGISKLIEESGEMQQVAGKLIAAGGEIDHWDGTNLCDRLQEEIADTIAACEFVISANELNKNFIKKRVAEKLARFNEWHKRELVIK